MSAQLDLVALSLIPLSRWRAVASQWRSGASASEILRAQCAEAEHRAPGRRLAWGNPDRLRERAAEVLARAAEAGLQALTLDQPAYPALLREICDCPPVLWVGGCVSALEAPSVAIVGSRAGSAYALAVAERLGADLAASGVAVVSGLARGVDSAAHHGALAVDGVTIAVLGSGADVVYPPEHAELARRIGRSGALVSELTPGTWPRPAFFPRRNRIISGLARAVVVVEAGEKSGSLITARCALEQGRDVLAVPGNVLTGRNRGGHALLRDGARLVETADDILDEIGVARGLLRTAQGSSTADPVLASLVPGEPSDLAEIQARSGLSAGELLPRLMELELAGALRREPGGRFVRFGQTC